MEHFINGFISELSTEFYIHQVLTVMALFFYGFAVMFFIRRKRLSFLDVLLAYPVSLALYSISGYFLLSFGIVFNRISVVFMMLLVLAMVFCTVRLWKTSAEAPVNDKGFSVEKLLNGQSLGKKELIITVAAMTVLILISVSGIFSASATNDSVYYFGEYPRALVHYGKLNFDLDVFMTDAAQGVAVLGTLPFFFGFDEMYGVQSFLNIVFIMIFAVSAYDLSGEKTDRKVRKVIVCLSALMLLTSMPYVILSRWFMANAFFMQYMYMAVYLAYRFSGRVEASDLGILSIVITGLSIMRIEGALNTGFIVLCIMMLEYRNRDIAAYMICPVLILQAAYLYRVFGIIKPYVGVSFMTKQKAAILIVFLVAMLIYTLLIRNRLFKRLLSHYKWLLLGLLAAMNVIVMIYDSSDYITNLKAFAANLTRSSGWGLFVSFVAGVLILVPKKSMKFGYFDIAAVCYVLLTVVLSWARGDTLNESFGDSGNRVMIQVVPLVLMVLIVKIAEGLNYINNNDGIQS